MILLVYIRQMVVGLQLKDNIIMTRARNSNELKWEDLRVVPGAFQFLGANDPTLSAWQPGASGATFRIYKFQSSDEIFFTCQVPHAYKQGTSLEAHLHWTPADRGNEESTKTVAWKLDYSWANIAGVVAPSSTADLTDTCTGTDDLHEMTSSITLNGTGKTISSMLVCRLYRDTGDSWVGTTAAQSPGILEFDLHYQIDDRGSQNETSK